MDVSHDPLSQDHLVLRVGLSLMCDLKADCRPTYYAADHFHTWTVEYIRQDESDTTHLTKLGFTVALLLSRFDLAGVFDTWPSSY